MSEETLDRNVRMGGKKDVAALLARTDRKIVRLLLSEKLAEDTAGELKAAAEKRGVAIETAPSETLDKLAGRLMHSGALAIYERPVAMTLTEMMSEAKAKTRQPLILVLDEMASHPELETLLRIALLSGAVGLVRKQGAGGPLPPAIEPHLLLSEVPDLLPALDELRSRHKLWVLGVSKTNSESVYEMELDWAMAVVFGGAGQTLRPELAAACDVLANYPLGNEKAPISEPEKCAVLLYDLMRQRLAWAARGKIIDVLWESDAKKKKTVKT